MTYFKYKVIRQPRDLDGFSPFERFILSQGGEFSTRDIITRYRTSYGNARQYLLKLKKGGFVERIRKEPVY